MFKIEDLTNKKYGKLTAIKFMYRTKERIRFWLFRCDCGNEKIINKGSVIHGRTKSCGCIKTKMLKNKMTTHGKSKTTESNIWFGIKQRCYNKKAKLYKHYGGRGIKVCDRWLESFENFYKDMGKRPSNKHSIDRINNNGDYTPENCRWATKETQSNNKRTNFNIEYNGKIYTLMQLSKEHNIHWATLRGRILKKKWSIEKSLSFPIIDTRENLKYFKKKEVINGQQRDNKKNIY